MGNPKQKWTSEEEEALRAGVAKHGPGKWKLIQKDPDFNVFLHSRSNIDLKDKWRNMSAAVQGGSRDKLRTPRPPKPTLPLDSAPISLPAADEPTPPAAAPAVQASASNNNNNNNNNNNLEDLPDPKNGPRYNDFIFQALSESPTGLDISSIVSFIEQRTEVPPNFRKPLGARLRRLVHQDKLHKVDNLYRLKNNPVHTNSANRKDNSSKHHLPPVYSKAGESLEEAAKTAAFKVVEAETKSYAAAQAVKEADNFSILAEEADSILQFAQHIFDRCSRGELVLVA